MTSHEVSLGLIGYAPLGIGRGRYGAGKGVAPIRINRHFDRIATRNAKPYLIELHGKFYCRILNY